MQPRMVGGTAKGAGDPSPHSDTVTPPPFGAQFAAFQPMISMSASLRPSAAAQTGARLSLDSKPDRFAKISKSLSFVFSADASSALNTSLAAAAPGNNAADEDLRLITSLSFESDARLDWVTGEGEEPSYASSAWSYEDNSLCKALSTFEANCAEEEFTRAFLSLYQMLNEQKCPIFSVIDVSTAQCVLFKSPNLAFFSGSSVHTRRELLRREIPFSTPAARASSPVRDASLRAHDEFTHFRKSTAADTGGAQPTLAKSRSQLDEERCVLVFSTAMGVRGLREYLFNAWSSAGERKLVRSPVAFPGCTIKLLQLTRPVPTIKPAHSSSPAPAGGTVETKNFWVTRVAECFIFNCQAVAIAEAFERRAKRSKADASVVCKSSVHYWTKAFQDAEAKLVTPSPPTVASLLLPGQAQSSEAASTAAATSNDDEDDEYL